MAGQLASATAAGYVAPARGRSEEVQGDPHAYCWQFEGAPDRVCEAEYPWSGLYRYAEIASHQRIPIMIEPERPFEADQIVCPGLHQARQHNGGRSEEAVDGQP